MIYTSILATLSRKAIVSGTVRHISIFVNHDAVVTIIFLKSVYQKRKFSVLQNSSLLLWPSQVQNKIYDGQIFHAKEPKKHNIGS